MSSALRILMAMALMAALMATPSGAQSDDDGTILYVQDGHIWASSAGGAERRQVTTDGTWSSPSVAVDGTIVAVRHGSPRSADEIARVNPAGEVLSAFNPELVFDNGITEVVVDPSGAFAAYTTVGLSDNFQTVTIHRIVPAAGGAHVAELFDESVGIAWSGDTLIAAQDGSDAVGYLPDGGQDLQDWFVALNEDCMAEPEAEADFCDVSPRSFGMADDGSHLALTGCDPFVPTESALCADVLDVHRLQGAPPAAPSRPACRVVVEPEGSLDDPGLAPRLDAVVVEYSPEEFGGEPDERSVFVVDVALGTCTTGEARVLAERASDPWWTALDLLDAAGPGPVDPGGEPEGVRLDGGGRADPVGQAIATSQALFADGAADRVVLATAERFPDALAGSALAGDDGPILLTPFADDLDPRVAAEIARVTGGEGVALILGGTAAVSEGAAEQARAAAGSPTCGAVFPSDCRYAGSGREDTAARIAATVLAEHGGDRALLARGDVFADAITGGAYAAQTGVPILLTPPDQLNGSTYAFIEGNGIDEVIVLGGIAAVDQPTMDAVPASQRRRIEGRDRTETAAAIATQLWVGEGLDGGGSVLVNVRDADGWQTALTGAVFAAVHDAPQLGVENPPAAPTQATLDAANTLGGTVVTLGGTDLVSVEQRNAVQAAAD